MPKLFGVFAHTEPWTMLDVHLWLLKKKAHFLPSTDTIICNQLKPLPVECSNQVIVRLCQVT